MVFGTVFDLLEYFRGHELPVDNNTTDPNGHSSIQVNGPNDDGEPSHPNTTASLKNYIVGNTLENLGFFNDDLTKDFQNDRSSEILFFFNTSFFNSDWNNLVKFDNGLWF